MLRYFESCFHLKLTSGRQRNARKLILIHPLCEAFLNHEPEMIKHLSSEASLGRRYPFSVNRGQSSFNSSFSVFSGCSVQLFCLCIPASCVFIVFLNPGGQFKHKHSTSSKIEKEQCTKRS